jgi:hypothetical protein
VSSLQQKAILANDLDNSKIRAIDAELDSFSTYPCQIDDNDVDKFLSYTAKIKRRYARRLVLTDGIMERCLAAGIAADIAPAPPVPPPVEPTPEQKPVEICHDRNGTPIRARGYPHTPWHLHNLAQQASTDPEGQPNGFGKDDKPDDGGQDPNGGGYDDPDEDNEPPSQRTHAHGNHCPTSCYDRPDPGNHQALENSIRCCQHSTLLYYTANPKIKMANQVKW